MIKNNEVVNQLITQRIENLEKLRSWRRIFLQRARRERSNNNISALTLRIAESQNLLHSVSTLILALTACRFGDIKYIKLTDITDQKPVYIRQTKGHSLRRLPGLEGFTFSEVTNLDPTVKIPETSYDALRFSLQQRVPNRLKEILERHFNHTHVFRHLRASFMKYQGYSESEIQLFFKHQQAETTRGYIHEALFKLFTQNQ